VYDRLDHVLDSCIPKTQKFLGVSILDTLVVGDGANQSPPTTIEMLLLTLAMPSTRWMDPGNERAVSVVHFDTAWKKRPFR
jgi:hypothetical protein